MNARLNQIAPETVGVLVRQAAAHGLSLAFFIPVNAHQRETLPAGGGESF